MYNGCVRIAIWSLIFFSCDCKWVPLHYVAFPFFTQCHCTNTRGCKYVSEITGPVATNTNTNNTANEQQHKMIINLNPVRYNSLRIITLIFCFLKRNFCSEHHQASSSVNKTPVSTNDVCMNVAWKSQTWKILGGQWAYLISPFRV